MCEVSKKEEFRTTRYELAVAIGKTTTRIESACQEVLYWARELPDAATFKAHIDKDGFSSAGMRSFVSVFKQNLKLAGAPEDDELVWQLLRRFQILVFDFQSHGADHAHQARERCRTVIAAEQRRADNEVRRQQRALERNRIEAERLHRKRSPASTEAWQARRQNSAPPTRAGRTRRRTDDTDGCPARGSERLRSSSVCRCLRDPR